MNYQGMNPYSYMMTPWQQMQQMYQLQSTMYEDQKKMIMNENDVWVVKFFFINEEENRRVKVKKDTDYKGLFTYIRHYLQPYFKIKGARIDKMQYEDDDSEWINFNSQKEWEDCVRLTLQVKKTNVIKIKVFTLKKKKKKVKKQKKKKVVYEEPIIEQIPEPLPPEPIDPPQQGRILPVEPPRVEPPRVNPDPLPPQPIVDPVPVPVIVAKPKHNHRCDICKVHPIVGKLFSSTTRQDFDLCEKCYEKRANYGLSGDEFDVFDIPGRKIAHVGPTVTQPPGPVNPPLIVPQVNPNPPRPQPVPIQPIQPIPPVIPQPRPQQMKYQKEIQVLKDMGFHDIQKNLKFLVKHKGDVQSVVKEFLDMN